MSNRRLFLSMSLLTLLLSGEIFSQSRELGNLVIDGIPDIPPRIVERLNQYQNVRSASFQNWNPNGPGMLVSTRFGEAAQIHYVEQPGGRAAAIDIFQGAGWRRELLSRPRPQRLLV